LKASNARLKDIRRLSRRSERSERRLFLADGPKAVEAALESGCVEEVFLRAEVELPGLADGVRVTRVEDRALERLSDSVSPAGVVALCRFVDVPVAHVMAGARLVAICADVRDPGNAGTVIRCTDAAGADGVVLAGSSVDAYNPKTVRASVGSLFHLPLAVEPSAEAAVRAAKDAGLTVLAADGAGEVGLYTAPLAGPTAWLFGNEAWGLPAELAALADHRVAIPIHGKAESLNLSTAAALCLYESARAQRPQ
jgi:TrmH family RNA methyltransferase